ncbi:MAG TPA: N-formylglutamate amidohydrolase [Sphingomicrobium sp.]|nr:N-formylglutamate amidohydrolase [Sphingomicrobium sp.]
MAVSSERWWTVRYGPGRIVATAIHDGHELRPDVARLFALPDLDQLREEDPFTGAAVAEVPTHVIVHRSRFEFDLNRAPEGAVYRKPDECWGLEIWTEPPDDQLIDGSLALHSQYYRMLGHLLDGLAERHGCFVLIDAHSYNHRRGGPTAAPTPSDEAPDINIGTFSMPREHWAFLMDPLIDALREFDFNGRRLDVRENVAFQGRGYQTRFVHERYPTRGCAIALEFKKFFMDEWTGVPDEREVDAMRRFVAFMAQRCEELLG